jgi:hypothetical protein
METCKHEFANGLIRLKGGTFDGFRIGGSDADL